MLFLGLGTGLGTALVVNGVVKPMELGHLDGPAWSATARKSGVVVWPTSSSGLWRPCSQMTR